jgi:hypothetical protein
VRDHHRVRQPPKREELAEDPSLRRKRHILSIVFSETP